MTGNGTVVRGVLAAALAGLVACAATPPPEEELPPVTADAPPPAQPIAEGRWELIASTLAAGGRLPGAARATLEFKDGRLAAYSGCNRAVGSAVEAEGRLAVGRLATTRMACAGSLGDFERRYFSLLQSEPLLRFEGDELVLVAGKENARFQRAELAPGAKP